MKNTTLVNYLTESGTPIVIEVANPDGYGDTLRSGNRNLEVFDTMDQSFNTVIDPIKAIANDISKKMTLLEHCPNEIGLEFSLKFSAKVGIIVTSIDSEASFKVSLKWKF